MGTSTPGRIATPRNFILKFGIRDYARDITPHASFGADWLPHVIPKYVKYNAFVTFMTGQTAAMSHMLNGSNDTTPFARKYTPKTGVNRQFQAKLARSATSQLHQSRS